MAKRDFFLCRNSNRKEQNSVFGPSFTDEDRNKDEFIWNMRILLLNFYPAPAGWPIADVEESLEHKYFELFEKLVEPKMFNRTTWEAVFTHWKEDFCIAKQKGESVLRAKPPSRKQRTDADLQFAKLAAYKSQKISNDIIFEILRELPKLRTAKDSESQRQKRVGQILSFDLTRLDNSAEKARAVEKLMLKKYRNMLPERETRKILKSLALDPDESLLMEKKQQSNNEKNPQQHSKPGQMDMSRYSAVSLSHTRYIQKSFDMEISQIQTQPEDNCIQDLTSLSYEQEGATIIDVGHREITTSMSRSRILLGKDMNKQVPKWITSIAAEKKVPVASANLRTDADDTAGDIQKENNSNLDRSMEIETVRSSMRISTQLSPPNRPNLCSTFAWSPLTPSPPRSRNQQAGIGASMRDTGRSTFVFQSNRGISYAPNRPNLTTTTVDQFVENTFSGSTFERRSSNKTPAHLNLKVKGITRVVTADDLFDIFSEFGKVTKVIVDNNVRRAQVEYQCSADAEVAVAHYGSKEYTASNEFYFQIWDFMTKGLEFPEAGLRKGKDIFSCNYEVYSREPKQRRLKVIEINNRLSQSQVRARRT